MIPFPVMDPVTDAPGSGGSCGLDIIGPPLRRTLAAYMAMTVVGEICVALHIVAEID